MKYHRGASEEVYKKSILPQNIWSDTTSLILFHFYFGAMVQRHYRFTEMKERYPQKKALYNSDKKQSDKMVSCKQ